MKLRKKLLLGLSHRIAYAALISALVWILALMPRQPVEPYSFEALLALAFDLPIAVATQPLPCKEFALDLWFSVEGGEGCPQGFANQVSARERFFNHMRVGIPVYMLLFYLPNVFLYLIRWGRRRRMALPASRQLGRGRGTSPSGGSSNLQRHPDHDVAAATNSPTRSAKVTPRRYSGERR